MLDSTTNANTKQIHNAPISPSKKTESEARETTVSGSDQHTRGRKSSRL